MITPYSEKKFISIFTNNKPSAALSDPEAVIKSHQEIFEFMEKLPGTFCFIYDFFNARYVLVSKSIRKVTGQSEEILLKGGFQKALEYFHPEDRNNIGLIHQELFGFLYRHPPEEFTKFRYDFNYRALTEKNTYIQLLQQSVITTMLDGKPLYDFSTCTDVTQQKRNNRLELNIYKQNNDNTFDLVHEYVVPSTIGFGLSATEFSILKHASTGLSSKEIADKCCRSLHTINNHRKNILSKTNSNTIAEAVLKVDI